MARILELAGLGHWRPKDIRDTFASHLLTRGISPAYVAKQLGHSDWSVTARHYARWTAGDYYVEPERLKSGEVPADLLSRSRAYVQAAKGPDQSSERSNHQYSSGQTSFLQAKAENRGLIEETGCAQALRSELPHV